MIMESIGHENIENTLVFYGFLAEKVIMEIFKFIDL